MNAAIDVPAPADAVDSGRFHVRGWVWIGEEQSKIAGIEAWSESSLIGETDGFCTRADVVAVLGLAETALPGFDFFASCPEIEPGATFDLHFRIRWIDGSRSPPFLTLRLTSRDFGLCVKDATTRPKTATHEDRVKRWLVRNPSGARDFGVEIGAFKSPIPGISPLYLDRFPEYDYETVNADYVADASSLPVFDNALDYVANANVFEHLANPVGSLWEWARVCRHNGIIYLVVPDRRLTFDRFRPLTSPEHLIEDFERNTTDSDGTHVTDYIDGVDWSLWAPRATEAERLATKERLRAAYVAAVAAKEPINIHFHTFELASFSSMLQLMNRYPDRPCDLELVDASELFPAAYPSGFLVVMRVKKRFRERAQGWWRRLVSRGNPSMAMRPDAKPFANPTVS